MDPNEGLSPEEMKFFETGDASVLGGTTQEELPQDPLPAAAAEPQVQEPAAPQSQEPSPLELALEQQRQRTAQLERELAEARTKPAAPDPADEIPDPETDPLGNMIAQLNNVNKTVARLQQELNERQQREAIAREVEAFRNNVQALKVEFTKTTPDFEQAYAHVRNVRLADLQDAGLPKADAIAALNQEELRFAATQLEKGKNPAEAMYAVAKRYGYTAAAAPDPAKQAAAQQQKAEQQVGRLANGQFAAKQPTRAAPPASGEITYEGLKDAGESDLNKVVADDKAWATIVGGAAAGGDIFHR